MNKEQFHNLLKRATEGDKTCIEEILKLYSPLIDKNSYIHGKFDEDLRQYLLLKVYKNIGKFNSKN